MNPIPDLSQWLKEAKAHPDAGKVGIYLTHNGVVRETARAAVRNGAQDTKPVTAMRFSYDAAAMAAAEEAVRKMDGVFYVRTWLNTGVLQVGDDIMFVLVGGDTRPHAIAALETLVQTLKTVCVKEEEVFG